ncbi:MAG: hypothetical protein R3B99_01360 [Polyangiales bacterium]
MPGKAVPQLTPTSLTRPRLAGWLDARRDAQLVGRDTLLTECTTLLSHPDVRLLHLVGPEGVGKSALLHTLATRLEREGRAVLRWSSDIPLGPLGKQSVLVVDALDELASPVETLTRIFETVPDMARVLVTSRQPLPDALLADPALAAATRTLRVPPLDDASIRRLAVELGIDDARLDAVVAHARGIARVVVDEPSQLERERERVRAFVRDASPFERDALYVAGIALAFSESLLVETVDEGAAAFERLREAFAYELGPFGLVVPPSLGELVLDELQARAPERRTRLARAIQDVLLARLEHPLAPEEIAHLTTLLGNALRFEPFAFVLGLLPSEPVVEGAATANEEAAARAKVGAHEGSESVQLWDRWALAPERRALAIRARDGTCLAVATVLELGRDASDEGDPVVEAFLRSLEPRDSKLPARLVRHWTHLEHHQARVPEGMAVPKVFYRLLINGFVSAGAVAHWDAASWVAPGMPMPMLASALVDGVEVGAFGADFRFDSVAGVYRRAVACARAGITLEREKTSTVNLAPGALLAPLREALRAWHRPDVLGKSGLLALTCVRSRVERDACSLEDALREEIRDAVGGLGAHGHDATLVRVLRKTYFDEPTKGLVVADTLGMGHSTYRRWLRAALERLAGVMEQRELGARR